MHHFPAHHSLTHHVFLQLGMAGYYNGRKKAKMALMTAEKVTCRVSTKAHNNAQRYVVQSCISIL